MRQVRQRSKTNCTRGFVGDGGVVSSNALHASNWRKPIDSAIEISRAGVNKCHSKLHRASLADVGVEEVKPTTGIRIRLCVHNYGAAETIKRCEDASHSESTTCENCDGRTIPFRERFRSADASSRRFGVVPLVLRNIQKRRQILFSR
jgi:hypothetical protein